MTNKTLTDHVRSLTGGLTGRLGMALHKMGVHPDAITILGLIIVIIAAVTIAGGALQIAGVILLLGLPLDALDGAVARAMQRKGQFGAMLDSSLDRYADGFIFAALSYHFGVQDELGFMLLAQAALVGSLMVSYTRARGEGLGVNVKIGLFTRMERVVVVFAMLLVPPLLIPGLVILAVGTNFTAMQRIVFVFNALKEEE